MKMAKWIACFAFVFCGNLAAPTSQALLAGRWQSAATLLVIAFALSLIGWFALDRVENRA